MVKEKKLKAVENLKRELESAKILGIVDLKKMPNRQFQEIKKQIRGKAKLIIAKKSTVTHAMKEISRPQISEFQKLIPPQAALLVSDQEPFKLYGMIDKMKSPTYAKEGDIAGEEILVSAGPTSIMAGPVISEFNKAGIPAGVEEGKIAIKKDRVVAKPGDTISKDLAGILRKLKLETTKVGLRIIVLYDNGMIYDKEVLSLVGKTYIDKLISSHQSAMNLSVAIGYPTKENIKLLLAKAYRAEKAIENKIGGK